MKNIQDIYNEIRNDTLIKLADDAITLSEYASRYFGYELTIEESEEIFKLLNQPDFTPPAPIAKAKKPKSRVKKLATA